jgi:two-component system sensor histidine kinase HydH
MNAPTISKERPFQLLRRFGIASLAVIAAIAIVNGALLTEFVTKRMLDREAHVTRDFVQNVMLADRSIGYLTNPADAELAARFDGSIVHFTSMPDVQRINVYSNNRTVLWSTDRQLIGRQFAKNDELEGALRGDLIVEGGGIADSERSKPEHVGLNAKSAFFVETYIPIIDPEKPGVQGVVELYKAPVALTAAIRDGHKQIWITACLGALVLYLTLFWVVRSADRKIKSQHERLLKAETMAAVGELASSIAHNIRNPLASIRSSAELMMDLTNSPAAEQADDIMASVDRIEEWLRDLVSFAHVDVAPEARVDAVQLVEECFGKSARDFQRGGIMPSINAGAAKAEINVNRALLGHVLHSILANAIEATPHGGHITGSVNAGAGKIEIRIADTGRGIATENLKKVFSLFFTTKSRGLGIGLALAQRAVERYGGAIRVDSTPGSGTAFTIELPSA